MNTRLFAAAFAMLAALPPNAKAQATDNATPFRAGQWGIEGYASGQGGGILRFLTPRTALVFTLSADHLSTSSDDASGSPSSNHATQLDATLGLRRHSMVVQHIAATLGAGLAAGTIQQKVTYPPPDGSDDYRSHHIAAFVDVGGQYMVADHFAVGLAYRLMGEHFKTGPLHQTGFDFSSAFVPLRATLYF